MGKVRFNLLNPKRPETHVLAVFRYDGQTLRWYTGYTVKPRLWNGKAQRFRTSGELPNGQLWNDGLAALEIEIEAIFQRHRLAGEMLPPEKFRTELDSFWKGRTRPTEQPKTFWQFFDRFIDDRRAAGTLRASTVKTYQTARAKLAQFEAEARFKLDWKKFDRAFSQDFTAWAHGKNYSPTFTRKVISQLKVVLAEAVQQGFDVPPAFRDRKFFNGLRDAKADHIFLTESELSRIAALNLDDRPKLAECRDLFLFGAFTSLRFSDFSKVSAANVQTLGGQPILRFEAQKTGKKQIVPLSPEARAILEKRGGDLPKARANQVLNRRVKEVARLAGIIDPVEVSETKGGFRVFKTVEKWELVASHTARRSFATNEFLRLTREGRSIEALRSILGHSTETQTRAYVKADSMDAVLDFAKSRFAKVG